MSLDLINIEPTEILDLLKKAYYDQTGESIQIGSDAFAASAVQSYVWSLLLNNINNATRNRFIDTANGQFLDAIASNYGIFERPAGYHATARFELDLIADNITIPAGALVVQDNNGNKFANPFTFLASERLGTHRPVMIALDAGSALNGIPAGEINEVVSGDIYINSALNITMTTGGSDGFPYTQEGDDLYREWLKTEIQSYSGAGTYLAYQARAKNADSRVLGVYVIKQTDQGYEKGKVKIYIYTDPYFDLNSQVKEIVLESCRDPAFRPVGDLVVVNYSPLTEYDVSESFVVSYDQRFSGVANDRNERILNKYIDILKSTINKPFSFEELCAMIVAKDQDGVYALDCKPVMIGSDEFPYPIYPEIGGRISPQNISFINKYRYGGA